MNKRVLTTIALAAMLTCSACAERTKTATLNPVAQQFSSLQWDEATAAQTAAHVSNNSLIMMR